MIRELDPTFIPCACGHHALVVQRAEWDCEADKDAQPGWIDLTMWTLVPSEGQKFRLRDIFYWPRYWWRLRNAWRGLTGERYAEWAVIEGEQIPRLIEALTARSKASRDP